MTITATFLCYYIISTKLSSCTPDPAGITLYQLAHGRPMGVDGRAGAGRPAGQLLGLAEEKQAGVEIGRYTKYNTRLSVNLPYTSCTHTDTPTHLRVAQWAHLCGFGAVASTARPVCGVSGVPFHNTQYKASHMTDRQTTQCAKGAHSIPHCHLHCHSSSSDNDCAF